jgi:6-phosphogluconolactonase (cycloisomerase 2 family)
MKIRAYWLAFAAAALVAATNAAAMDDDDHRGHDVTNVVYVHSNNPQPGKNSVLAYTRNPNTGELTEMAGSPFLTGGTGFLTGLSLGPDDHDQEIVTTRDRRFLYVVNQGSDTIAGFAIALDGSLKAVPGSPFSSGGVQPASLGVGRDLLIVANRGDQQPGGGGGGTNPPTYASFRIFEDGSLFLLPVAQPAQGAGSSPSQALVSPDGKILFDAHLFENPFNNAGFPPFIPPASTELHSYKVEESGELIPAAQIAPAVFPPFIIGLQVHPKEKILYAGFAVASELATYTYDDDANMTLVSTTPGAPNGGLCWIAISPNANYLYTADAVTDQIDVFSIAADPLHPQLMQTVNLGGIKNPVNFVVVGTFWDTAPFQLKTSPDGRFLYVVNHEFADPVGNTTGNALHILEIGNDGTLTEIPSSPMLFPVSEVPMTGHPLGVLAF